MIKTISPTANYSAGRRTPQKNSGFANEVYRPQSGSGETIDSISKNCSAQVDCSDDFRILVFNAIADDSRRHQFDVHQRDLIAALLASQRISHLSNAAQLMAALKILNSQHLKQKKSFAPSWFGWCANQELEKRMRIPLDWIRKVYGSRTLSQSHLSGSPAEEAALFEVATEWNCEAIARDANAGMKMRFDALLDWLRVDKTAASNYILSELPDATDGWRDVLVHASMDTWFDDAEDQQRLVAYLIEIAADRRYDMDASSPSVTRTAILRAGSLLGSSEIDRLQPFLSESKTMLAALVAMLRIVTNDPPSNCHVTMTLITELRTIISRFSDPLVHRRGEIDASLFNSLNLVAVYSPADFSESLKDLARLKKPFLFKSLSKELNELKNGSRWIEATNTEAGNNLVRAIEAVDQQLA